MQLKIMLSLLGTHTALRLNLAMASCHHACQEARPQEHTPSPCWRMGKGRRLCFSLRPFEGFANSYSSHLCLHAEHAVLMEGMVNSKGSKTRVEWDKKATQAMKRA